MQEAARILGLAPDLQLDGDRYRLAVGQPGRVAGVQQ
jgi:hypothetical protein